MARGCSYYEQDPGTFTRTGDGVPLSNGELAIALLAPSHQPTARQIRLAAALLGAADEAAADVATLAVDENCVGVVRYIASCGSRFEPENPFWAAEMLRARSRHVRPVGQTGPIFSASGDSHVAELFRTNNLRRSVCENRFSRRPSYASPSSPAMAGIRNCARTYKPCTGVRHENTDTDESRDLGGRAREISVFSGIQC